ncbi:glycerol-3-phosphate dehydrogenase [Candidatus Fermentibacteria bacterium]|nr:glycerol-3-phosphate dehydrogenase [Candidatus Fermentibacteria bacterium]
MTDRLSVIGCGRWGSFHLWYGVRLGMRVIGWEPESSEPFRELRESRRNAYMRLPDEASLTCDLRQAAGADVMVVSVPVQKFRGVARLLSELDLSETVVALCMKGLERDTGKRPAEIAREEGIDPSGLCAWVGPGHPQQLLKEVPSCMLVAAEQLRTAEELAGRMGSDLLRLYRSTDLVGAEIGAATKNVAGIAAGMLDGMGYSGLKGALMARAPQEVARLVTALGGDWRTVFGLSHLGDYQATLFSPYSRNRAYGEALVRNEGFPGLAEGVETSVAVVHLADRLDVDMPITNAVKDIIDEKYTATEAVEILFGRPEREEFGETFSS